MCFSAEASFGASAAIAVIGAVAIKKAATTPQKVFAMIPVFFAIQQCMEGILWLCLSNPAYEAWAGLATYIFLFFAWIVWPVYIPLSVWLLEAKKGRKQAIGSLMFVGTVVSAILAYRLFFHDVHAEIAGYHIKYVMDREYNFGILMGIAYFVPTVISLYISSRERMMYVATTILLSFIVTMLFFSEHLISVWCFFAAVTSVATLWALYGMKSEAEPVAHMVRVK